MSDHKKEIINDEDEDEEKEKVFDMKKARKEQQKKIAKWILDVGYEDRILHISFKKDD